VPANRNDIDAQLARPGPQRRRKPSQVAFDPVELRCTYAPFRSRMVRTSFDLDGYPATPAPREDVDLAFLHAQVARDDAIP